ncbi:MAG: TraR/DksA C4-type zinc finger protein [Arenicella sp.]|nr:TraR/DksA C4-type zinc finger protein [Arenicella sp.]
MHEKLTLEQKSHIESLLLKQRAEYEELEKHGSFSSASRFDSLNERSSNFDERARDDKLGADVKQENHYLAILSKIDRCLKRLDDQTCGECIDCGQQIGYDRMVAFPMAERCLSCKIEFEKSSLE